MQEIVEKNGVKTLVMHQLREATGPSYAEQKRLETIDTLYSQLAIQTEINEGIHKKIFIRKKTREQWLSEQRRAIDALTLAIDILGKINFKDDVYPFEIANKILGLTPYQIDLILEGADASQKELKLYHNHGIWKDNYKRFVLMEEKPTNSESTYIPLNPEEFKEFCRMIEKFEEQLVSEGRILLPKKEDTNEDS